LLFEVKVADMDLLLLILRSRVWVPYFSALVDY
jgi:hypothetical protein